MFTKEIMDTFSELDFAVYDCIINNRERVSSMTIKELGNLAHVSTATVLRFCKKSGVNGYSEFKIKYKEYLEGKRDALKDVHELTILLDLTAQGVKIKEFTILLYSHIFLYDQRYEHFRVMNLFQSLLNITLQTRKRSMDTLLHWAKICSII